MRCLIPTAPDSRQLTILALLAAILTMVLPGLSPVCAQAGTVAAPQAATEALPKVEQVMDWYVEATGGQAAYDKINNRVTKSTMEISGAGIKLSITLIQAKPDKAYSVADSPVTGKIEGGSNGEVVWELSAMAGPQLKEGKEKATLLHMNTMDRLAYWRKAFKEVRLDGMQEIDGKPCYKVVATPEGLPSQTFFIDKQSHLMAKALTTLENQMGVFPIEATFNDYKTFDGLQVPVKSIMKIATQERVITVDSLQHNVQLPADRFEPPAEIKALLKKNP